MRQLMIFTLNLLAYTLNLLVLIVAVRTLAASDKTGHKIFWVTIAIINALALTKIGVAIIYGLK